MTDQPTYIDIVCMKCGNNKTRHELLCTHREKETDREQQVEWQKVTHFLRCAGCDTARIKQYEWFSENTDQWGRPEPYNIAIWPTYEDMLKNQLDIASLPEKVQVVYRETIAAIQSQSNILAGAGLRTIVEAVCQDRECGGKDLQKKIDRLVEMGLLAKPQADFLHEARHLGNSTLHKIKAASDEEVAACKTIIDGLLHSIYILPSKYKMLKELRDKQSIQLKS